MRSTAQESLDVLAKTVGIVLMRSDEIVAKRIPVGSPEPDRTHMLRHIYRGGGWVASEDWGEGPDPDERIQPFSP